MIIDVHSSHYSIVLTSFFQFMDFVLSHLLSLRCMLFLHYKIRRVFFFFSFKLLGYLDKMWQMIDNLKKGKKEVGEFIQLILLCTWSQIKQYENSICVWHNKYEISFISKHSQEKESWYTKFIASYPGWKGNGRTEKHGEKGWERWSQIRSWTGLLLFIIRIF